MLLFIPCDYCRMATPFIFMKRVVLRGVATGRIGVKNMGNLCQCSVEACGLLHHVALEEANTAAIDAFRYPIVGDRHLLPPLNLNLHLLKVHHHILTHHRSSCAPHKSGPGHQSPFQRFPPQHRSDEKDQAPVGQARAWQPLPRPRA